MSQTITRRRLIAGFSFAPALLLSSPQKTATPKLKAPIPAGVGEFVRFSDPATENAVVRLTNPATASLLPDATNRFVSLKGRFLVFSSDRNGHFNPFRADLRTGALTQIADTETLRPGSLCLDEQDRILRLLEGDRLVEMTLGGHKTRVVADGVSAYSVAKEPSEFVVVRRHRLEYISRSGPVLADDVADWCLVNPGGTACLFGRELGPGERDFWSVSLQPGQPKKPVKIASGLVSNPRWSSDGHSIMFLRSVPGRGNLLSEIREVPLDSLVERTVAKTSQFAVFNANDEGTVFVGASRSKAQPTVILLLRSVGRELTLCEHRAHEPTTVTPVFAPDSRRVYFQSDRDGKSAIYSINVETMIEPSGKSN